MSFIQGGAVHGTAMIFRAGLSGGPAWSAAARRPGRARSRSREVRVALPGRHVVVACSWTGPDRRRPSGCAGSRQPDPVRRGEQLASSPRRGWPRRQRAAAVHQPGGGIGEGRAAAGELLVPGVLVDGDVLAGGRRVAANAIGACGCRPRVTLRPPASLVVVSQMSTGSAAAAAWAGATMTVPVRQERGPEAGEAAAGGVGARVEPQWTRTWRSFPTGLRYGTEPGQRARAGRRRSERGRRRSPPGDAAGETNETGEALCPIDRAS